MLGIAPNIGTSFYSNAGQIPSLDGESLMEWVLIISLQWIVLGSPTQPTIQQIDRFQSEELCSKAAEAIRNEINAPIPNQRVQTLGRVVCIERRDK
jgi:hypothetical protein